MYVMRKTQKCKSTLLMALSNVSKNILLFQNILKYFYLTNSNSTKRKCKLKECVLWNQTCKEK